MILVKRIKSIEVDKSTIERMPDTIDVYSSTVSLTYNTWWGKTKTIKCEPRDNMVDGIVMYITERGFELSYDASKKIHDTVQFVKEEMDKLEVGSTKHERKPHERSTTQSAQNYSKRSRSFDSEFDDDFDDEYGYDSDDLVGDMIYAASDIIEDAIDDYYESKLEDEIDAHLYEPDTTYTPPVREEYVPEPDPTPTYTSEPEPYTPPTRSYEPSSNDYSSDSYDSGGDCE